MTVLTFKGGIHPKYNKDNTASKPITSLAAPKEIVIPLSQHIGAPARACVEKGDAVKRGQVIGEPGGFVSVPIHSSVSGEVKAVEPRLGAMGVAVPCVVIENDEQNEAVEFERLADWKKVSPDTLKDKINAAGIVGMGGATFPTHVKLSPPNNKPIDTVILNGAECEPYLTADHRVMLEHAEHVVEGLQIIQKILNAKTGIIGIEENKPDAVSAMEKACEGTDIKVVRLEIKYPQGGEKQLIDAVLKKEVPSGGLPMDVGVVVQNVGTAKAVRDAVVDGIPLIERVVTVTGSAVAKPGNFMVSIGTPVSVVLEHCEVDLEKAGKLILGGPMMGFAQYSAEPPVAKGTSGILVFEEKDVEVTHPLPCIRCGRCLDACPMRLVPADIAAYSDKRMYDKADANDALDCMECGSCAHQCPSQIPLVQKIRLAKSEILAAKRKKG
ncbi:MAG: electron transport complex subunit RsxC [Deltaproteobacteria bacterium]|nr:electron transport complex subunit RsxC [Deltaproteobacteria bacterium]MBN2670907.1 electron transport complex subunit RsxC [Deltaproteobacteria bacterium]